MKLQVLRISSQQDSTNGILFDVTDGKKEFLCYTIEDEYRDEKVMHETRIPEGTYKLTLRTAGGFHNRYLARYGADWHKGMLELQDVPNFQYILIHTGNTDEHTSGCILVADSQENNLLMKDGFAGKSGQAYKRIYPVIRDALLNNEKVTIEINDVSELSKGANGVSNKVTDEMMSAKMVYEKLQEINGNLKKLDAKIDGHNIL